MLQEGHFESPVVVSKNLGLRHLPALVEVLTVHGKAVAGDSHQALKQKKISLKMPMMIPSSDVSSQKVLQSLVQLTVFLNLCPSLWALAESWAQVPKVSQLSPREHHAPRLLELKEPHQRLDLLG